MWHLIVESVGERNGFLASMYLYLFCEGRLKVTGSQEDRGDLKVATRQATTVTMWPGVSVRRLVHVSRMYLVFGVCI